MLWSKIDRTSGETRAKVERPAKGLYMWVSQRDTEEVYSIL